MPSNEATHLHCCSKAAKLLFCITTSTEFHSHFHAFILTEQTIIKTDCDEGMLLFHNAATFSIRKSMLAIIVGSL